MIQYSKFDPPDRLVHKYVETKHWWGYSIKRYIDMGGFSIEIDAEPRWFLSRAGAHKFIAKWLAKGRRE